MSDLEIIQELVSGIERWAADEDGVPEELFPAYQRAKEVIAHHAMVKGQGDE